MIECTCRKTLSESANLSLFQALLEVSASQEATLAAKAQQAIRHAVAKRAKVESLSEEDYQEASKLLKLIHDKARSKKASQASSILASLHVYVGSLAAVSERIEKDWIQSSKDSFKDFATRKASRIPVQFLISLLKGNVIQAWQLRSYLLALAASDSARQYRQTELTKMIATLVQTVYSRSELRQSLLNALPSISDAFLQIFHRALDSEDTASKRLKDFSQAAAAIIKVHSKLDSEPIERLWNQPFRMLFEAQQRETPAVLKNLINKTSFNENKRKRPIDNQKDADQAVKRSKAS